MKQQGVSHNRQEETPEAKALWFQSLSLRERMQLLVSFTDLILEANPQIAEKHDVESTAERVQVLAQE